MAVLVTAVMMATGVSLHGEVESYEQHGKCIYYTDVDDFTDDVSHGLACFEDKDNIAMGDMLKFECYEGGLSFVLLFNYHTRTMDDPEGVLPVRYRFDKGAVYSGDWMFIDGKVASLDTAPLLEAFLAEPDLLVFEIDGEKGRIDLSESDTRVAAQRYIDLCPEALNSSG